MDGGSTSSKAVLVDEQKNIIKKEYQLSKGNPIQDTKELLTQLKGNIEDQGAKLEVMGFGATGYAADVLEQCVVSDVNVVETLSKVVRTARARAQQQMPNPVPRNQVPRNQPTQRPSAPRDQHRPGQSQHKPREPQSQAHDQ